MNKKLFWIFALSSAIYFTQGIEGLPSQGLFYYLKENLNFLPEKIMLISSITTLAWLVKPLIGYLIDNFLNKRAWIAIALGFDIILALVLGVFSFPVIALVTMLVLSSAGGAFRDVSVDGIMCVEGKKYQATGKIQSIQWMSISVASLITGIGGGYIAHQANYKIAFLCLIPVYFVVGLITYLYRQEESSEATPRQRYHLKDLRKLFQDKQLLLVGIFVFLYRYSPSFGTPLFFIQRDVFKWGKIWIGVLSTISTVFSIIGALLYYKFSQRIRIKKWLFWSVLLGALTTLSYLYYVPLTAVIYDTLYSLLGMFIFVMVLDFMARNTSKGLEATSFAFLASVSNLALTASNLSGALLLPILGLKWLIIVSSLTSFLCLPLIQKIKD